MSRWSVYTVAHAERKLPKSDVYLILPFGGYCTHPLPWSGPNLARESGPIYSWLNVGIHKQWMFLKLTGTPSYLSECLHLYVPSCTLRSSSSVYLHIPRTNLNFGSLSFHIAAPTVWNSLPSALRSSQTLNTFWKHLKTHLFQSAFNSPILLGFERYRYWDIGYWPILASIGWYWYWPNTFLSNRAKYWADNSLRRGAVWPLTTIR